jgi:hypothetical protein
MLAATPLLAAEHMTVSVCTLGHLSESALARAEAEASTLFHPVDVEISWAKCEDAPVGEEAAQQHWFTVRMCGDPLVGSPGPASLDTLGEAFISDDQSGYLVEVYYKAAQTLASREEVDSGTLLGCVMAHEIGHLLLGPGHAPDGVMRALWDARDMDGIRKGWLKFRPDEGVRIRKALRNSR